MKRAIITVLCEADDEIDDTYSFELNPDYVYEVKYDDGCWVAKMRAGEEG